MVRDSKSPRLVLISALVVTALLYILCGHGVCGCPVNIMCPWCMSVNSAQQALHVFEFEGGWGEGIGPESWLV